MCKLCSRFKTVIGSWPLDSVLLTVLFDFLYPLSLSELLVFTRCCKIKDRTKGIFGRVSQLGLSKQFCYTVWLWKVRDFCCIKRCIQCKGYQPYPRTSMWISSRSFPDGFSCDQPIILWTQTNLILKFRLEGMAKPTALRLNFLLPMKVWESCLFSFPFLSSPTFGLFYSSLVHLNAKVNGVDYTDHDKGLGKYFLQSGGAFPRLWTWLMKC